MAIEGQIPLSVKLLIAEHTDISAASISYVVVPCRGKLKRAWSTLHAAITGAPAVVTVKRIRAGATTLTLGTITITHTSSAAGDVDSVVPTVEHELAAGDVLAFDSDGASSTTARVTFTAEIETAV